MTTQYQYSADTGAALHGGIPLQRKVTCPHCWHEFKPEDVLWVAQHEELIGDPILPEEHLRFLPSRFTVEGQAIDARGIISQALACPNCHLQLPRALLENEITFVSLIGSPGSGKSNFLAAMTWELRQKMARHFALLFTDADKEANWIINRYEETLFLPSDPEKPVMLDKTRTQGDLYRSLRINGQETKLPKPFLFTLRPTQGHPYQQYASQIGRTMCLYDNAGEHFGVGEDTSNAPVTRHLSRAKALMFLFDPTQDPRFRKRCQGISTDPQIVESIQTMRQETILSEASNRIRKLASMAAYAKYDKPLLVLVAKSDIYAPLIDEDLTTEPLLPNQGHGGKLAAVDTDRVERVSLKIRQMLLEVAPEVVTIAEDFCQHVVYIPVSALGHAPERVAGQPGLFVRPKDVKPSWVTVPILYAYAKWSNYLVAGTPQTSA